MNLGLLALCIAATALVAIATSAAIGVALLPLRRALEAISPAAQARVLLLLALLPCIACGAVMAAVLAPSFGWIADHCDIVRDLHQHPHLCGHYVRRLPGLSLLVVASAFVARVCVCGGTLARQLVLNVAAKRALDSTSALEAQARVLPFEAPHAFVLGVVRPTLYVTRGLLGAAHREHLESVLAHERAHLRRADPLRMLLANAGLVCHLPGIADALRRQLLRAQEMAADHEAARVVGSRERVARALVALSRAQLRLPALALGFGACGVQARVERLLDERARGDVPTGSTLLVGVSALLLMVAFHAGSIHHAVEQLLGALGG